MSKKYEITFIEYNAKMAGKYDGAFLSTKSVEGGAKRKDFVFGNSKQFGVLKECAKGDIVELKITKNGDFYNLAKDDDAIKLVSKGGGQVDKPSVGAGATKAFSGGRDNPDVQSAIIRQNALTNSVNLVTAMLEKGMFPAKVTSDILVMEVTKIATEFAKYSSGELGTSELLGAKEPKPKAKVKEEPSDDSEFGE